MTEWRTATVIELQRDGVLLVEDGNHGEYRPRSDEFTDNGVAFIRAADMDAGRIDFSSASKIDERARQRITKGIGAPGDVILSHKGTVGKVALAPEDAPPFVCSPQTTFWRTCDEEQLDRKFLYVFLRSPNFHAQLATRAGETDMAPYVSLTSQRGFSVTIPPIRTQRDIAATIGAFDDKIDLNCRMNETLEAMARTIFKDWFIDFGPTRAKMEGRTPYLTTELWALFPDHLDDEGKPVGWELQRIEDLLELAYGKALPAASRVFGEYPVYGSGGINGYHSSAVVDPPAVIVGRKGTVGSLYWEDRPCFPIDTVFYVIPKVVPLTFSFYLLQSLGLGDMNTDAAVPGLNRSNVYRLEGAWGTPDLASRFDGIIGLVRSRIFAAEQECRTLAGTRDLLLPKLMSGEIRVKDVEKLLDEAAE